MCMQSKSNLCGNSYFPAAGQAGRAAGRTAGRTARKAAGRTARKAARKAVRKADVAVTGSCQQLSNKISSWNANIVADGYLFGLFFFSFSVVFVCLVLRIRLETERLGKEFSCKRANQGPWNSGQLCESVLGSGKCTQLSSFSFFFFFPLGVCVGCRICKISRKGAGEWDQQGIWRCSLQEMQSISYITSTSLSAPFAESMQHLHRKLTVQAIKRSINNPQWHDQKTQIAVVVTELTSNTGTLSHEVSRMPWGQQCHAAGNCWPHCTSAECISGAFELYKS